MREGPIVREVFAENSRGMIGHALDDIAVETKDAKFMRSHDPRKQLHNQDLVIQGVLFV